MSKRSQANSDQAAKRDLNADPITGEPGAHPLGAGAGAVLGGAVAGAAGGAVGGPIGAVAGAVIGGVAGGLAGKATAESIDPTVETTYWRQEYPNREYYSRDVAYEAIEPAYRYGWEGRTKHPNCSYAEASQDLEKNWPSYRGKSNLDWKQAQLATRDAWERVESQCGNCPTDK